MARLHSMGPGMDLSTPGLVTPSWFGPVLYYNCEVGYIAGPDASMLDCIEVVVLRIVTLTVKLKAMSIAGDKDAPRLI